MPNYKLVYSNKRGRAELIRLLFEWAEIDYEDKRITMAEWEDLKPNTPDGYLPILEVDGTTLAQSIAIARYIARKGGVLGKDDIEMANADRMVDLLMELSIAAKKVFTEKDEKLKEELTTTFLSETAPPYLKKVEKTFEENNGGDGYVVGTNLTWADFACIAMWDYLRGINKDAINEYRLISEHDMRIRNLPRIAQYLNKRPVTSF